MVTSYALVVPIKSGQAARELVTSLGIGRADLKLGRRDGHLLIPIQGPVESPVPGGIVEVAEFDEAHAPGSYKDHVHVSDGLRPLLPSSFDIVGDLVVIKIPDDLTTHGAEIGRAILAAHPNIKGVFHDEGVQGPHRVRKLVPLAGENRTQTVHSEFGAKFRIDVARAYFSPRLANEHDRVAKSVKPGETFVDATCGVGPFTILVARRRVATRIVAIDLNEDALALLRENLKLNRVETDVVVLQGDAADRIRDARPFQRAAINLPHGGEGILAAAWATIQPRGVLHYYTILPEAELGRGPAQLATRLSQSTGRNGVVEATRVVHAYSPLDRLVSIDFRVD